MPPRHCHALAARRPRVVGRVIVLRAINHYGDPDRWLPQRSWLWNAMAFVRGEKYPPSLDYLMMTLGPALIALALAP